MGPCLTSACQSVGSTQPVVLSYCECESLKYLREPEERIQDRGIKLHTHSSIIQGVSSWGWVSLWLEMFHISIGFLCHYYTAGLGVTKVLHWEKEVYETVFSFFMSSTIRFFMTSCHTFVSPTVHGSYPKTLLLYCLKGLTPYTRIYMCAHTYTHIPLFLSVWELSLA